MRRLPSPGGQRSIAQAEAPEDPVQPIKAEPEDPASTVAIKEEDVEPKRIFLDGEWVDYIGELNAEGRPFGKGKITWEDGEVYEGDFIDGKQHGKGRQQWVDCSYEGDFKNGVFDGHGKYKSADGLCMMAVLRMNADGDV